jgi:hypothetical protein
MWDLLELTETRQHGYPPKFEATIYSPVNNKPPVSPDIPTLLKDGWEPCGVSMVQGDAGLSVTFMSWFKRPAVPPTG